MVGQTASEILKLYFLGGSSTLKWSPEQAWTLVKALSKIPQISYNNLLLDPLFPDESTLRDLAQAEFITIVSTPEGRPSTIKPGRPVFSAAFALLANDKVFSARMELGRLTFLQGEEKKNIEKAEEELAKLTDLPAGQAKEIEGRIRYVLRKIQTSQLKIQEYDVDMFQVKEVLKKEM
jgi:RNA12 protein